MTNETSANSQQVGGTHYQSTYPHWDLVIRTGNAYLDGQITKYATRYRKKNGLEDLDKAVHYAQKLRETVVKNSGVYAGWPERLAAYDDLSIPDIETREAEVAKFCAVNGISGNEALVVKLAHARRAYEDTHVLITLLRSVRAAYAEELARTAAANGADC